MACTQKPVDAAIWRCVASCRLMLGGLLLAVLVSPASGGDQSSDRFRFTGAYRFPGMVGASANAMHLPPEAVPIPVPNAGALQDAPSTEVPLAFPKTITTGKPAGVDRPSSIISSIITRLLPDANPTLEAGDPGSSSPESGISTAKAEPVTEPGAPFTTDQRSTLGALDPADTESSRATGPTLPVPKPETDASSNTVSGAPGGDDAKRTVSLPSDTSKPKSKTRSPAPSRRARRKSKTTAQSRRAVRRAARSPARRQAAASASRAASSRSGVVIRNEPPLLAPTPPWAERAFDRGK